MRPRRLPTDRRHARRHGVRPRGRGAVIVEFVIVLSLLVSLSMGGFEYGWMWRSSSVITNATRDGARVLSSLANDPLADYQALSSLRTELSSAGLLNGVQRVVIYKSATADGQPPTACKTGTSLVDPCHVISGAQLQTLSSTLFGATGCLTGALIANYCPTARNNTAATADYVGIWANVRHNFITGLFGSGVTINVRTVVRVEPDT